MKIEINDVEAKVILQVLKISDPLGIWVRELMEKIVKQIKEQIKEQKESPKELRSNP